MASSSSSHAAWPVTRNEHAVAGWPVARNEHAATEMANNAIADSAVPKTVDEIFAGEPELLDYLGRNFSMKDPLDEQQKLLSATVEVFSQSQVPMTNTPAFAWQNIPALCTGAPTADGTRPYFAHLHTGALLLNIPPGIGKEGLKRRVEEVFGARALANEYVSDRDITLSTFHSAKSLVNQLDVAYTAENGDGTGSRHTVLFTSEGAAPLQVLFGGSLPESQSKFIALHELGGGSYQAIVDSAEGRSANTASTIIL